MRRILSDFHLLDASSRVRRVSALAPLAEGVDELILNGDSLETQVDTSPAEVAALSAELRGLAPQVTFITGNHDPDLPAPHELTLLEGRIWVTHGDILFPDLAPWSSIRPVLIERLAARRQAAGPVAWADLPTRLELYRDACRQPPREFDTRSRSLASTLQRLRKVFFPPSQPLGMLRAWRTAPDLARVVAREFHPAAQVIVNGHIHFPFVSRQAGAPTVINTGSFSRPFGGQLADIAGKQVVVRRIIERRGEFYPGAVVAEIPLVETRPSA